MRTKDLTRLYTEHARPLYAFLSYRTGDPVLAEDLLADTFERVLNSRSRHDPRRGTERTWLYAIALNCVRDHGRRVGAETRALARVGVDSMGAASLDGDFAGVDRRDALRSALSTLTPEEIEALALRYGADLTLSDVAAVIDEPRTKVEARVYRGLKKLRAQLGPDF